MSQPVLIALDWGTSNLRATLLAVALGVAFFAVFAFYLHQQLFGVRPFGA